MSERYGWRNLAVLDRFSTDPHGGHRLESASAHVWRCTRCGLVREGVHRPEFYTKECR